MFIICSFIVVVFNVSFILVCVIGVVCSLYSCSFQILSFLVLLCIICIICCKIELLCYYFLCLLYIHLSSSCFILFLVCVIGVLCSLYSVFSVSLSFIGSYWLKLVFKSRKISRSRVTASIKCWPAMEVHTLHFYCIFCCTK